MKSLIIIAHGSRKETSNIEVIDIVNQIKNSETSYSLVEPSFLEFATPSIEDSVKKSIDQNLLEIYIYPYFLNSGKHVTSDIPNTIKTLEIKYPLVNFTMLPHFGESKKINEIILSDIDI